MARNPQGHIFKVTVKGKVRFQADRFHVIAGQEMRISGRGSSMKEASDRMERNYIKRLVQNGEAPPSALNAVTTKDAITVDEWVNRWFAMAKPEKTTDNTFYRQQGILRNHVSPYIGSRNIRSLTPDDLKTLIYETLPNLKNPDGTAKLGSSPIRGVYYLLRPALTEALAQGRVGYDLFATIKPPKKDDRKDEFIADKVGLPGYLRTKAARTKDNAYWIMAFYGLRQSERLGLCWSQFHDLEKKTAVLVIDRQLLNNAKKKRLELKMSTKSKAGQRIIPLPETVRKAFIAQQGRLENLAKDPKFQPEAEFSDLCFLSPEGKPIRHNADNKKWRELLSSAKVPHMRQHAMRHIAATQLAEAGVPAEVAQGILGHSTAAMTSYYTHIGTRAKLPAVEALDRAMEKNWNNPLD